MQIVSDVIINVITKMIGFILFFGLAAILCRFFRGMLNSKTSEKTLEKVNRAKELVKYAAWVIFFIMSGIIIFTVVARGLFVVTPLEGYPSAICILFFGLFLIYFLLYLIRKIFESVVTCVIVLLK